MNIVQISRVALAPCCMALALLASPPTFAEGPDIQGCWQGESVVIHLRDGSSRTQAGACSFQVVSDRILMRCPVSGREALIDYSYRITKPGTYTATMTSHSSRPDLVGGTRDYQYRLEGERLFITTHPQTTTPLPPAAAVKTESVSVRAACK
jgi:hypothetical protein